MVLMWSSLVGGLQGQVLGVEGERAVDPQILVCLCKKLGRDRSGFCSVFRVYLGFCRGVEISLTTVMITDPRPKTATNDYHFDNACFYAAIPSCYWEHNYIHFRPLCQKSPWNRLKPET